MYRSAIISSRLYRSNLSLLFLLILNFGPFFGCSTKKINQLQGSVETLERRLQTFQQTAEQENEFTTGSLTELQQELTKAFRDIRYSQSNMESLIEQISNRLSTVERQTESMQAKLDLLETQALDNFNTLTTSIQDSRAEATKNLNQHIENIRPIIDGIRAETSGLKQQDQSLQSSINRLQAQLDKMNQENRKVFDRILSDLGVDVPTAPAGQPEPASGKTYTVQPGDSLSKIAAQYNISTSELQNANNLSDPSLIRVGQVLRIPE